MNAPASVTQSALPVLDALEALLGYPVTGATNKDLADALRVSPPAVTRAMATLIHKGWARKDEGSGRFFPTPAFPRLLFRVTDAMTKAEDRLRDMRHSMTGG